VVIMGALGKDFHTFNMSFKDNEEYRVLAFTVAEEQNVGTVGASGLTYPPELAGSLYPKGIPLISESKLEEFVKQNKVHEVVFSYSDVSHLNVMHKASRALAAGADFRFISPSQNMIAAHVPLIAICAVRTGCGKSQVSRAACHYFKKQGFRVVAIREPMPYGDLLKEKCMRFANYSDLQRFHATIEEREEYEPYIEQGLVVYSGVDYQSIIEEAEKEADIVIWDGGNNEVSFYYPDLLIVVADPLRPGAEKMYHPGEVNVRSAHAFIVNKVNAVKDPKDLEEVLHNLHEMNPSAAVVMCDSVVSVAEDQISLIKGRKCVVVEDGPTTTHGNMSYGAGMVAAQKYGSIVVDPPLSSLQGSMKRLFEDFPHLKNIVPAMGYNDAQTKDLIHTLNAIDAQCILNGSPLDLGAYLEGLNKPVVRVTYDIQPHKGRFAQGPTLDALFAEFDQKFLHKVKPQGVGGHV